MESTNPPRLLDQVRGRCRVVHYSLRAEQACGRGIHRFIVLHDERHPGEMGGSAVEAFRSHLAGQ